MTDETGAAPAEGQAAPSAGAVTSWTDGFSEDLRGYVETKGFADAGALADSYQNLEKLQGVPAEQLLKIPADMSDLEAMAPVYAKMGRPETADAYTNVLGEDFDAGTFSAITEAAHMVGMGDGQLQRMQEVISDIAVKTQEAKDEADNVAFGTWKDGNPEGYHTAAKVMAEVGMSEQSIEGVLTGDKTAIYDMLAKVGARSAEGQIVQGEQPSGEGFNMSPQAAKQKVSELLNDGNFTKAYYSQNKSIRQPAIDRMTALQKIASGEGA